MLHTTKAASSQMEREKDWKLKLIIANEFLNYKMSKIKSTIELFALLTRQTLSVVTKMASFQS